MTWRTQQAVSYPTILKGRPRKCANYRTLKTRSTPISRVLGRRTNAAILIPVEAVGNVALSWAFPVPLTGPRKSVLVALAEHADDTGHCWPSVARISLYSGVRERAVRTALHELAEAGVIRSEVSNGRLTSHYFLPINTAPDAGLIARLEQPKGRRHARYPASGAVLNGHATLHRAHSNPARGAATLRPVPLNPAPRAPESLLTLIEPSNEPSLVTRERPTVQSTSKRAKAKSMLTDDWKPTAAGEMAATERNLDVDRERRAFANHHIAKGNMMADWDRAWLTWCDNAVRFSSHSSGRSSRQPESKLDWMIPLMGLGEPHEQ